LALLLIDKPFRFGDSRHRLTELNHSLIAVGLMHRFVSWVKSRSPRLGRIIDDTPLTLFKKGQWQDEVMRGMRLNPEDVMAVARTKNFKQFMKSDMPSLSETGRSVSSKTTTECP
jgi:uncharacterized membrane protein YcaP (DUF421 family)